LQQQQKKKKKKKRANLDVVLDRHDEALEVVREPFYIL
jgi:hypothetical protein